MGTLPDLGEVLALRGLQDLCDEITTAHEPGAKLTICSDGHVFSDLVEVSDEDVLLYNEAIAQSLQVERLSSIELFDMRSVWRTATFDDARRRLVEDYALPLASIRERARAHPHHRALFNGIHRFLFEDAVVLHPELSRSQVRKATRSRAYEVIRRSDAWGRLIAARFPEALRLSIHPQPRVSDKIGIHLLSVGDAWLTPWHGVALLDDDGARLVKRHQAEDAGARLVEGPGTSHFTLLRSR